MVARPVLEQIVLRGRLEVARESWVENQGEEDRPSKRIRRTTGDLHSSHRNHKQMTGALMTGSELFLPSGHQKGIGHACG